MGSKTKEVSSAEDYQFLDPTGKYAAGQNFMQNQYNQNAQQMGQFGNQAMAGAAQGAAAANAYDPNAYMDQFMGQASGLSNLVSGQNSQLQQTLNAIAGRQAGLGSEAALAAMPGAANSGAGMAAFGQAYADPFAQAQAALQQNQLQGTLGLWNNAMGLNAGNQQADAQFGLQAGNLLAGTAGNQANLYGGLAGQALGGYGQMAQGYGTWYQPTYEKKQGLLGGIGNAVSTGAGAALGLGALGWKPFG